MTIRVDETAAGPGKQEQPCRGCRRPWFRPILVPGTPAGPRPSWALLTEKTAQAVRIPPPSLLRPPVLGPLWNAEEGRGPGRRGAGFFIFFFLSAACLCENETNSERAVRLAVTPRYPKERPQSTTTWISRRPATVKPAKRRVKRVPSARFLYTGWTVADGGDRNGGNLEAAACGPPQARHQRLRQQANCGTGNRHRQLRQPATRAGKPRVCNRWRRQTTGRNHGSRQTAGAGRQRRLGGRLRPGVGPARGRPRRDGSTPRAGTRGQGEPGPRALGDAAGPSPGLLGATADTKLRKCALARRATRAGRPPPAGGAAGRKRGCRWASVRCLRTLWFHAGPSGSTRGSPPGTNQLPTGGCPGATLTPRSQVCNQLDYLVPWMVPSTPKRGHCSA